MDNNSDMIKGRDLLYYVTKDFSNSEEGLARAEELVNGMKNMMKAFLEKHDNFKEDYRISVGDIDTTIEYIVYKDGERTGEPQAFLELPDSPF